MVRRILLSPVTISPVYVHIDCEVLDPEVFQQERGTRTDSVSEAERGVLASDANKLTAGERR